MEMKCSPAELQSQILMPFGETAGVLLQTVARYGPTLELPTQCSNVYKPGRVISVSWIQF